MLEQIDFLTYPDIELKLTDGTTYHAHLNEHNRRKLDLIDTFPTAHIDFPYCVLRSEGHVIVAYLEKI